MNSEKSPTENWPFEFSPSGLDFDAKNLFVTEHSRLQNASLSGDFEKLKPLKTYEEYLRERDVSAPERAERVIRKSNPDSIRRVNELVAEYNNTLPWIKSERNAQLGLEILGRMNRVFNGQ